MRHQRILITGTTSGLGRALLAYYHRHGQQVIALNRRDMPELWQEFPGIQMEKIDISCKNSVHALLGTLVREGRCPDLFILNAGINRPDNYEGLDFDTFATVMKTNLFGVMSFAGAIHDLGLKGKTLATISSTSNIVPNPAHIGYAVSKHALHQAFKLLRRKDPENEYKSIILGPVHTNIMAGYPGPAGLQKQIFDWLALPADEASKVCAAFFESRKVTSLAPFSAAAFYWLLKVVLALAPGIYQGSVRRESLVR